MNRSEVSATAVTRRQDRLTAHWPLLLAAVVYCLVVLPRLGNYPPANVDDAYNMAPGHSLLTRGTWGSAPLGGAASQWRNSSPDTDTYFQPPLYLMLVTLSFKILGFGLFQARLVSVLLGLGVIGITYSLAVELGMGRLVATASTLLLLSQPLFVRIARQTRPDVAVTFFTLLGVFAFARYRRHARLSSALVAGAAAGAGIISHYNGVFGAAAILLLFLLGSPHFRGHKFGGLWLCVMGVVIVCLPYAWYVLRDYGSEFYSFKTQVSVVGRAGSFRTVWEYVQAESQRYRAFLHDYRFAPGSDRFLTLLYIGVLGFAAVRRSWRSTMLLLVVATHLILLIYPSPNKTSLYLGTVLPYLMVLIGLCLVDVLSILNKPVVKTAGNIVAISLVCVLLWLNGRVWWSYLEKYEECGFYDTVAQIRNIIPEDTSSVMGRYTYWIGLSDYEYYRWGFRSFEDIAAVKPQIFIHNDYSINRPRAAELKAKLDAHFEEHAVLLGEVAGHPKSYCMVGNLQVYQVDWE